MKVFIREICGYWSNYYQRENLRLYLNSLGFYVLSGDRDTLNVYAIKNKEWWEKIL